MRNAVENKKIGMAAAEAYLERRGFDIIERSWTYNGHTFDFVAMDGERLVFVVTRFVSGETATFPPSGRLLRSERAKFESAALAFLRWHEISDAVVALDEVSIVDTGRNRAFIRHSQNLQRQA